MRSHGGPWERDKLQYQYFLHECFGFLAKTAFNLRYTLAMTGIRLEEGETNHMATQTRYWIMFFVALMTPFNALQAESEGQHEDRKSVV